MIYNTGASLI